ncbi:stage II sporulation protein R [Bacillus mesophilum]|uniref:Stage II sporulation protein R n=2 Tax=Bacillus mesophilum TaxID=1071718 RepID=A0A7V7RLA5_9BACI|nr:stage II sporulation protein R [Bacillus mesophilum]
MVPEMKTKWTVNLYILLLSIGTIFSLYIPQTEVTADEELVIPNEAIRLRILANSDSEADQNVKRLVRDAVNEKITEWVSDLTSVEESRKLLQSRLPEIQAIAERVVEEQNVPQSVKAEFGNVEFPTKLYGQFLYPAGEYEAILITLGDGDGANWWCVLFPPLCFLDFSNGVAVGEGFEEDGKKASAEEVNTDEKIEKEEKIEQEEPVYTGEQDEEEVEVKFFLVEIWNKIFG